MSFEIVGEIGDAEDVAIGKAIRGSRQYGFGRWRKLKGTASIRLFDGTIRKAEIHW